MSEGRCLACSQENCGYRTGCECECHGDPKKAALPKKPKTTEINCYEAHEDGALTLWADLKGDGDGTAIRIRPGDVSRLMHAAIDALKGHASRR